VSVIGMSAGRVVDRDVAVQRRWSLAYDGPGFVVVVLPYLWMS
jgi:hypothetical protein